ncbi:MAG: glycosyltransferase family 39 protein [Nitrospirae bacterium]|nr:glycosyltransferase family 39 protein [Nitrospirota bacterium]
MKVSQVIHGIVILLIFSLLLNLPYIHLREFQGEEGRRVIIALDMLRSGDWIVPKVEETVYLRKPPLYNWALACIFRLTGSISEATARLSSVITTSLCAIAISLFWRKLCGIRNVWFILPGMIFLTYPEVLGKAIKAEIDMTFTLFVTLTFISFFYFYEYKKNGFAAWTISLFFAGLGALTKGVQAPAFFYTGVIPYMLYKKEWKKLFSIGHLAGISVFLAVVLMWLVPLLNITGFDNLIETSLREITVRKEPVGEGSFLKHLFEFPVQYIISYSPWMPLLLLWRYKPSYKETPLMNNLTAYCLFFLIFSIPFYWIMPGTWLRYVLPLAGPLTILITMPLYSLLSSENSTLSTAGIPYVPLNMVQRYLQLISVIMILLAISSPLWGKRFNLQGNLSSIIMLFITFSASLLLLLFKGNIRSRLAILFIVILAGKLSWASVYFPYHSEHMSHYRTTAKVINKIVPQEIMLHDYGVDNPHLAYYLDRRMRLIASLDQVSEAKGAAVLMKKKVSETIQEDYLHYLGDVRARNEILAVFEIQ